MSGSVPMVKEIGDFYGLFKDTNVSWLTIGKRLHITAKFSGLFTFIRRFRGTEGKKQCFKFFIFAVVISIIISIVLIYIFSLKLSRPLKKINSAAKKIASGKLTKGLIFHRKMR